jgi:hypothetical protein
MAHVPFRRAHGVVAVPRGHWIGDAGCPGSRSPRTADCAVLVVQGRALGVRSVRQNNAEGQ